MTPIQKLNSFFIHKKQFEGEFASFGFSFNDTLKQEIKDLKKNNEFDRELIKKYIFIQSEIYFYKSIQQILRELEQEVNDKVNVVGQNDLKSEFIYSNIRNLHNLLDKIEVIFKEYPQKNINKYIEKAELFFHYVGIKDIEPDDIRTSDDILDDIVSIGNEIQPVPKDIILKLYDFEYSDVYVGFLLNTSTVINHSIKQIISENYQILIGKFEISKEQPFLIPLEKIKKTSVEKENSTFKAKHYVLSYIIECYAKGEIPPRGDKKKLEKIGNEIMGNGKGNTFYKRFNEIVNQDLNIEKVLISICGDDWRKTIKNISKESDKIETYLQSKQL